MTENNEEGVFPEFPDQKPVKTETIGEILAKARVAKGMSIDDVDSITHISPGWVIVIEQGNWSQYPSMVYAKGHVKVYAKLLGLNVEELADQFVKEWNEEVKPDPQENGALQSQAGMQTSPSGTSPNYVAWGVGGLLILLGLSAGFKYFYSDHDEIHEKKSLVHVAPVPAPIPTPSPQAPAANQTVTAEASHLENSSEVSPPSSKPMAEPGKTGVVGSTLQAHNKPLTKENPLGISKGGLILKLVALKSTWVVIGVDDGVVRRFHLNPGDSRLVSGKNFMTLSTEYGNGLVLFLNGKRLGMAGPNSDPVLHRRLNRLSLRPLHANVKSPAKKKTIKGPIRVPPVKAQTKPAPIEPKNNSKPQTKVIPLRPSNPQDFGDSPVQP